MAGWAILALLLILSFTDGSESSFAIRRDLAGLFDANYIFDDRFSGRYEEQIGRALCPPRREKEGQMTATVFYATHDTDGEGSIGQNADIVKFASRDEAEAYLRRPFDTAELAEEGLTVAIDTGSFGDCWIKSQAAPRVGEPWIAPFRRSQLYVQRPGQHPGGFGYWITPRADVLVALVRS